MYNFPCEKIADRIPLLFRWQYGTYAPVKNNYNWNNLTNTIWVEQPAGTGFSSKGSTPGATNEEEVAEQFAGFWKNFIETFGLQHKKIYVTGESYAGFYVPCQYNRYTENKNTANFRPKTLPKTSSRRTIRLSTMSMASRSSTLPSPTMWCCRTSQQLLMSTIGVDCST